MRARTLLSLAAALTGLVLLVASGCGGDEDEAAEEAQTTQAAKRGGTLRINLSEDVDHTDPALAYYFPSWQLEYATCVKLLNYPYKAAPEGARLQPEAAESMPEVSADGKTYTFTVRNKFKFSPPSNQAVTAETFRYTIQRVLNPKMQSPGTSFITDIEGAEDFIAGKANRVSGLSVEGDRLTIRLTRPAPDFLSRISMMFFCAVPIGTPINPSGEKTPPSAGPYYIAERTPKQSILLKRNPNYTGDRPAYPDQIRYAIGLEPSQTVLQIKTGQADHAGDVLPPAQHAQLAREWGPNSENAKRGKQRYFVNPMLSFNYFALNTSRPPFSDEKMRQAVSYAVDRTALARQSGAFGGKLTDQILPPGMPGYRDADVYPVDGPDIEKAKELMGGRTAKAVLYTCDESPCPQTAEILRQNLKRIGIDVEIKTFKFIVALTKAGTRGEPFNIVWAGWAADYADPYDFINVLLDGRRIQAENNQNFAYFNDPEFNRRMEEASRLTGEEREEAYAELDEDITRAAPLVTYENANDRAFFSERTGCQVYNPVYGMILSGLCLAQ